MAVAPPASVAVRLSSRWTGDSCAGAVNVPLDVPVHCWTGWTWHSSGQCRRTSSHDNAASGSAPSSGSVADPEKLMTSPGR